MNQTFSQSQSLNILTQTPALEVKALADELLPLLEAFAPLIVSQNRTGLVMLPYRDTVQGTLFHLGEVLVAEAEVKQNNLIGYGAVLGRDLEQALAVALLDLAGQTGIGVERLEAFLETAQEQQTQAHTALFAKVNATRVQMETF
ncbi:MAG: phosphonate lyase system protein PhnG [Deinococcota bacterium]|jgi:alpha-D-ribose 1-methylphosphonate 5-triphosphate synthase subunit PhnG